MFLQHLRVLPCDISKHALMLYCRDAGADVSSALYLCWHERRPSVLLSNLNIKTEEVLSFGAQWRFANPV
jgi:hypothetical protein